MTSFELNTQRLLSVVASVSNIKKQERKHITNNVTLNFIKNMRSDGDGEIRWKRNNVWEIIGLRETSKISKKMIENNL